MEFDVTKNRLVLNGEDLRHLPRGINVPSELTIAEAADLAFRLGERYAEIGHVAQRVFFRGRVDMTSAIDREMAALKEFSTSISSTISPLLEREFADITTENFEDLR